MTIRSATGTTKTYAYPVGSNRLTDIKQGATTLRAFTYDGAGNTATDKRGATTWTFTSDAEQRIAQVKSGASVRGAYLYDAFFKLAKRTVTNTTPAGVTHYLYDPEGHVIAETTSAGVTVREYVWLHDMPVAVIDAVNTASPVTYFVHTDHLMRPLKITNAAGAQVWDAVWRPFGEALTITAAPRLDLVFPGQWRQFESALHGNWHRHYDPTTWRYTRPDPLGFVGGPSIYGYVKQGPLTRIDPDGRTGKPPLLDPPKLRHLPKSPGAVGMVPDAANSRGGQ